MTSLKQRTRKRWSLALLLPYAALALATPFLHTDFLDEAGPAGRPAQVEGQKILADLDGSACLACQWIHNTNASPAQALSLTAGEPWVATLVEQPISAHPCPTHDPAGIRGPPQA